MTNYSQNQTTCTPFAAMPILDSFRASDFIEPDAIARPVVAYGVRFDSKGSELAPHQHRKAQIMLASRGVLALSLIHI